MDIYTHYHVSNRQLGRSCSTMLGAQHGAGMTQRGEMEWGVGGRFKREEAVGKLTADSYCCIAETNTTL